MVSWILLFTAAWAWVVPWSVLRMLEKALLLRDDTYTRSSVAVRVGAASFLEDRICKLIQIMIGVGIVIAFREAVNKDAGVWVFKSDLWVATVIVVKRQVNITNGIFVLGRATALSISTKFLGVYIAVKQVVSDDRVNPGFTEEATSRLESPEYPDGGRARDCRVNAVLDAAEYSDENTREEDGNF